QGLRCKARTFQAALSSCSANSSRDSALSISQEIVGLIERPSRSSGSDELDGLRSFLLGGVIITLPFCSTDEFRGSFPDVSLRRFDVFSAFGSIGTLLGTPLPMRRTEMITIRRTF